MAALLEFQKFVRNIFYSDQDTPIKEPSFTEEDGNEKPCALVVCGPSGVGKGTMINRLLEMHPDSYGFCVSHTTRKPRPGEVHGQHYYFTDIDTMEQEIKEGNFVEYAHVHGNIYGTSKQSVQNVLDQGKCCILDIDVQGSRLVRKSDLKAMFVFISPPSLEELESRLRGRNTETEEAIVKRLQNAKEELKATDEPGLFDLVITNNSLERSVSSFTELAKFAKQGNISYDSLCSLESSTSSSDKGGEKPVSLFDFDNVKLLQRPALS